MMMSSSFNDDTVCVLEEAEKLKLRCKHEEAIVLLERLLTGDPGNIAALEEVADNELSLGRYDRAITAAKQAVALDAESYMGHYILGFVASLQEDWETAVRELQAANQLKPNNPEILRCLGWTLFHRKRRVQGIVTLERALNLDPDNSLSLCDLGVCYLEVGNVRKAHALFRHALNLDPASERVQECVKMMEGIGYASP